MRFNDDIRANFDFCSSRAGVQVNNKNFSQAIKQAAEKFLTKIPTEQKQAYLSEATWDLIENRQAARAQSNSDLEQQLNAAIKRSARCDKKKWKLRMLEDFSSARAKWKGVKLEKSTFKPSFYKLKKYSLPISSTRQKSRRASGIFRTTLGVYPAPTTRQGRQERSSEHATTYQYRIHHDWGDTWCFTLIKNKQSPRPRQPHNRIVQISTRRQHEVAGENPEPNVDWRVVPWWFAYAEVVLFLKKATQSFLNTTVLFLCWTHHTKFWPKCCRKELQTPLISL